MSVLRLNEFKALPGEFENLVERFDDLVTHMRTIPGCERCELLLKVADGNDDDDRLIILEVWSSVEAHQAAANEVNPNDFAAIMAMLSEKPTGQYFTALNV